MNFLQQIWKNYISGFKKFNDFSGRATRSEFWSFALINGLFIGLMPHLLFLIAPIFVIYVFEKGQVIYYNLYKDNVKVKVQ